jgi:hypothetical protein
MGKRGENGRFYALIKCVKVKLKTVCVYAFLRENNIFAKSSLEKYV